MQLPIAHKYAVDILNWLKPTWERCDIAGSIRRQRPDCADAMMDDLALLRSWERLRLIRETQNDRGQP